jgi:acyl carrier protein
VDLTARPHPRTFAWQKEPTMLTRDDLLTWLAEEVHADVSRIHDDTPLFSEGMLDSFTMVELVALVEEKTGTTMPALEVTPENIDTVARIVAWAERQGAPRS